MIFEIFFCYYFSQMFLFHLFPPIHISFFVFLYFRQISNSFSLFFYAAKSLYFFPFSSFSIGHIFQQNSFCAIYLTLLQLSSILHYCFSFSIFFSLVLSYLFRLFTLLTLLSYHVSYYYFSSELHILLYYFSLFFFSTHSYSFHFLLEFSV
jgi:hypothetical protein